MTTIAFKDGIIAYDSRVCCADTIITDKGNKRYTHKGVHFFLAGNTGNMNVLVDCYFDRSIEPPAKVRLGAFIADGPNVLRVGINERDGFGICTAIDSDALGTGADHAMTAMDCHLSAAEAVRITMKRDMATGGRVRTFKVKGWKK